MADPLTLLSDVKSPCLMLLTCKIQQTEGCFRRTSCPSALLHLRFISFKFKHWVFLIDIQVIYSLVNAVYQVTPLLLCGLVIRIIIDGRRHVQVPRDTCALNNQHFAYSVHSPPPQDSHGDVTRRTLFQSQVRSTIGGLSPLPTP